MRDFFTPSDFIRRQDIDKKYIHKLGLIFQNFGLAYAYPENLSFQKHLEYSFELTDKALALQPRQGNKFAFDYAEHNYLHLKYLLYRLKQTYEKECAIDSSPGATLPKAL
jgi:hypothetical protein